MVQLHVEIQRTEATTEYYKVEYDPGMTVLNVLEEVYRHHDETIAYRYSCQIGLCATCMMMINGKPALSCMKVAKPDKNGFLSLAPLPKGETIKDLVKEV